MIAYMDAGVSFPGYQGLTTEERSPRRAYSVEIGPGDCVIGIEKHPLTKKMACDRRCMRNERFAVDSSTV
jgi:hypothetical protein